MILSLAITTGFKNAVSEKVIGFGSHIQITGFGLNNSWEKAPVDINQDFYPSLENEPGIRHIQVFANKSGLIKTEDQIQGIVMKGIWTDFDWSFFEDKLIAGSPIVIDSANRTDEILVSGKIADNMEFGVGDEVRVYFINPDEMTPRGRKFTVKGIYETGLEEFDDKFIVGDIRHIQRLNKWDENQVGGFEVFVDDFSKISEMWEKVYNIIGYELNATSIKTLYPQIFDWLDLQDMNVIIILILMVAVAVINMVSTLLILILEKTNMIGVLKALGTKNISVRKIFLYNAGFIIGRGLLFGNLLGIGLALVQQYFQVISLDQESYYVPYVPINLGLLPVVLLNVGTLLLCLLFLIVPSFVITKISPVKAIRWE
jgi:lipoprotein-releasing system permease protein